MSEFHEAIVIGAGPAGLATSHELARAGVSHVVLERGRLVGQTWADLYDGLVLHTTRGLSALPGLALPRGTPLFPTRAGYLAYLQEYAQGFALPIRTGSDVLDVRRAGENWQVRTSKGDVLAARTVVLATGIVSNPHVPPLAGLEAFDGCVMHSVKYRRPNAFAGQRVLVVGAGNSAADIAVELAQAGVEVTLAVRSGATVLPLRIAGLPSQYFGVALGLLPPRSQRVVTRTCGTLSRAWGRGALPAPSNVRRCAGMPIIGGHLSDAIRAAKVRLKGNLAELGARAARFEDGSTVEVDTVILATGYRPAVDCLREVVHLDACGFPERTDRVESADQHGLYFVGHTYDIRGGLYNIGRDARLAARRIRSTLDGRRRRSIETSRPAHGR